MTRIVAIALSIVLLVSAIVPADGAEKSKQETRVIVERYFRSLKDECLLRMIFFGEKSLHRAVTTYLEHYHAERNHQALNNRIIQPDDEVGKGTGEIECRERIGGLLRYYHRKAA